MKVKEEKEKNCRIKDAVMEEARMKGWCIRANDVKKMGMSPQNNLFSCFHMAAILLICHFLRGALPDLSSSLTSSCSFPL